MIGKTSLVILKLCVKLLSIVTLSSAVATVAKIEHRAASSSETSDGSTTTTVSTPTSATKPSANATTSKPEVIIQNIPTFDFSSFREVKPKKEVVTSCNKNDICSSMNGFCIRGKCKTKDCSTEIFCVCDPGFTGHICDKNITEIELKNGKGNGNGNHVTTSTQSSNKLNGNSVDTPSNSHNVKEKAGDTAALEKTLVNGKLKATPATHKTLRNEQSKDNSNTSKEPVNLALTNITEKQVASEKPPAVPPKQKDLSAVKSKTTSAPTNTDKVETKSKSNDKVLANGDLNFNLLNTKHDSIDSINKANNINVNTKTQVKESRNKASFITKESKSRRIKDKIDKQEKTKNGNAMTGKTISEVPSDGSYIKGPELHVPSEHSVVDFTEQRREINKGKQSIVKEQADVVTITSNSVEQIQLGKSPEMLTSGARDSLKASKTTKTETNTTNKKEKKIKPKLNERNATLNKSSKSKTKSKNSAVLNETNRENSPLKIVSAIDIVERNPIIVTEQAGSVNLHNNTVIEVSPVMEASPLLASSEIKITIETSNTDATRDSKTTTKDSLVLKPNTAPDSSKVRDKIKTTDANTASAESGIQRRTNIQNKIVLTETKKPVVKSGETATVTKAYNVDNPASKSVDASQNSETETRKSTQSEILTPIMQLMNIFRSEKFVKNVSAVKIEIITKQNKTDSHPPPNTDIQQINKSNSGKKSPGQTKDELN